MAIGKLDRIALIALIVFVVLAAVSLLPGWGAIVLDDERDIFNNAALHSGLVHALLKAPFRVVTYFTYWINVSFLGGGPFALHFVNFILHILVGLFLYVALSKWIEDEKGQVAGLIAAGFFLLNPFMGSAVLYISARSAILVSLGAIIAVWGTLIYSRDGNILYLAVALAGGIFALFSKETGLVVPIILLPLIVNKENRGRVAIILIPLLIFSGAYVLLRMGHVMDLGDRGEEAPTSIEYLWTQITVVPRYIRRFFWPVNLSLEWNVRVRRSALDPLVLSSAVLLAGLFISAVSVARRNAAALLFVIWIPLSLMVESSIIPLADLAFDHRFYFAGVGLAALLGITFSELWERSPMRRHLILVGWVIVICFALLGVNRGAKWSDKIGVWTEAVRVTPDSPRSRYNLGHNLLEKNQYRTALLQLNAALRLGPKVTGAKAMVLNARGLAYLWRSSIDLAINDFSKAASLAPDYGDPLLHLGVAYILKGNPDEAIVILQRAQALMPDEPKVEKALQSARDASAALHGTGGMDIFPR